MSNLPQDRPSDLSGYAQLGLMDQQNQTMNQMRQNEADRPDAPRTAQGKPLGGRYGSSGSGVNPFSTSYNPAGVPQANQWGNGAPNGNWMTQQNQQTPWMGNTQPQNAGWKNWMNG